MELKSRATPEYINCFCFDETRGFNIEDQKDIKWKDVFKMKINNLRHYLQSIYSTFENLIVCVCVDQMSHKTSISPACLCFFEFCEKCDTICCLNAPVTFRLLVAKKSLTL